MANIVLLFFCLVSGIVLRATHRMPEDAPLALNGFIINLALPALVISQMHGLHLAPSLAWPILMPWLMFLLSAVAFIGLARARKLPRATTGALIMTAGLANTSFVGLPMIETFYGAQQLATGILIDQFGSYLVLSTAGITVACLFSDGVVHWRAVTHRAVCFPPLIALILSLVLGQADFPTWLAALVHRLGDTVAPLALVSVGLQLKLGTVSGYRSELAFGLAFKLVAAPLVMAALYSGVLHRTGDTMRVTIFEAAMGPQIAGSIVAIQYGLEPSLVTLMVGLGIPLSLMTVPIWWWGLARI